MSRERNHFDREKRWQQAAREHFVDNRQREGRTRQAGYGRATINDGFLGALRMLGIWIKGGPSTLIRQSAQVATNHLWRLILSIFLRAESWWRVRTVPRLIAGGAVTIMSLFLAAIYEGMNFPTQAHTSRVGRIEGLLFPPIAYCKQPAPRPQLTLVATQKPVQVKPPQPKKPTEPVVRFHIAVNAKIIRTIETSVKSEAHCPICGLPISQCRAGISVVTTKTLASRPEIKQDALPTCSVQLEDEAAQKGYTLPQGETLFTIERAVFVPKKQMGEKTQRNEIAPISLAMVFDQSGSIYSTDPKAKRISAAVDLVNKLPADARATVMSYPAQLNLYNPSSQEQPGFMAWLKGAPLPAPIRVGESVVPVGDVCLRHVAMTDNKTRLTEAIRTLENRSNGPINQLFDSTILGIKSLESENSDRKRILINFSDGDDMGSRLNAKEVVSKARSSHVTLYFVSLGNNDLSRLRAMADATGGRVLPAKNSTELGSVFELLTQTIQTQKNTTETGVWEMTVRANRAVGKRFQQETLHMMASGKGVETQSFAIPLKMVATSPQKKGL